MRTAIQQYISKKEHLRQLILLGIGVLFCMGLFFLFYAYIAEAVKSPDISIFGNLGVQIAAFAIGLIAMYLVSQLKYHFYRRHIFLISTLSLLSMLMLITPLAIERNGAIRWIDLGVLQFQPSEILKIGFILFFAFLFTQKNIRNNIKKIIGFTAAGFLVLLTTAVLQPDYGSAVIIGGSIMGMAIIARLPKMWWISIIGVLVAASVALSFIAPSYIANRFKVFYDVNFGTVTPEQRYGEAYHSLQNLEAVRVGGLLGQGPGYVAQSSHLSIPEVTTDSIFALIAAETGFIGSVLLIILFLCFFLLCYSIAKSTKDPFGKYVVVGITTLFAAQFFVNILVVLGLPATGIPLIFFQQRGNIARYHTGIHRHYSEHPETQTDTAGNISRLVGIGLRHWCFGAHSIRRGVWISQISIALSSETSPALVRDCAATPIRSVSAYKH